MRKERCRGQRYGGRNELRNRKEIWIKPRREGMEDNAEEERFL